MYPILKDLKVDCGAPLKAVFSDGYEWPVAEPVNLETMDELVQTLAAGDGHSESTG